jgi:hypothetical protein
MNARHNPDLTNLLIVAAVLGGGYYLYTKKKAKKEKALVVMDEFQLESSPALDAQVDAAIGADAEGWVEDIESVPLPAELETPESPEAAAVLSDPDPSPAKEMGRRQVAIRLAKNYGRFKTKDLKRPQDFTWKAKKTPAGYVVQATSKSSGRKSHVLVKRSGKVTRLKKAA